MKPDRSDQPPRMWRSLGELQASAEVVEKLGREFPEGASQWAETVTRRDFIGLMGASAALAMFAGCRRPLEEIVPYVYTPEDLVLGQPLYYATSMPFGLGAFGLLVKSVDGRPVKIEGNPEHPGSGGGTNAFIQASILELYDPDRSREVIYRGAASDWDAFRAFWQNRLSELAPRGGEGLAVLSPPFASPTLARLKSRFHSAFPRARWSVWEPIGEENRLAGLRLAFGRELAMTVHYDRAAVVLALDADFLATEPNAVRSARDFAARRDPDHPKGMNRLFVVEPGFSVTGAAADHRLRLRASQVAEFAAELGRELQPRGVDVAVNLGIPRGDLTPEVLRFLRVVAGDLASHRGQCLVVAGQGQPAEVHALAAALNDALGNTGNTVEYRDWRDAALPSTANLVDLARTLREGAISDLVVLGGNPVYDAPADLDFAAAMAKAENTIHLGLYRDESGRQATWHLPQSHFLESWGDARTWDGTAGIIQPLILPLYPSRSPAEFLELLVTGSERPGYELVRDSWRESLAGDFEILWRKALHDGVMREATRPVMKVRPDWSAISAAWTERRSPGSAGLELVFQPDVFRWDGRWANLSWLQENPDPMTKLMWTNALLVSPQTARALGVAPGDVVRLEVGGRSVEAPVWVMPGMADGVAAATLGFGRRAAGSVGDGIGFDLYSVRTSAEPGFVAAARVIPTGERRKLPCAQEHFLMEGRALLREGALDEYRRNPEFAAEAVEAGPGPSLWKEHAYDEGYQWGMTIDLNACIGCGACTTACQSENNIPVVGPEQAARGREMHWIRVDRYFLGELDEPRSAAQPVACHHCEMAPCEQVCPVAATVHDHEGLNVMVYNRCVGTRYCSNNCPYKVRRFNFFNYTKRLPLTVQMAQNPDVTVRSRGVMEKCTYCIQRINRAKTQAKAEGRQVRDGEVVTACQQACPARAIVFGNLRDSESAVSRLRRSPRAYQLLAELNTRPRTSYLARIRNPHPDLEAG